GNTFGIFGSHRLLITGLDARQRAAVKAVCTDMHQPYINAVVRALAKAEIVFDKFHVLEVRRQEFFRAGAVMRAFGRGERWLLLRRWKTLRGSKRTELQQLFAVNHRLFKAYVLREQLDRLWSYKARDGGARFLFGWGRSAAPPVAAAATSHPAGRPAGCASSDRGYRCPGCGAYRRRLTGRDHRRRC